MQWIDTVDGVTFLFGDFQPKEGLFPGVMKQFLLPPGFGGQGSDYVPPLNTRDKTRQTNLLIVAATFVLSGKGRATAVPTYFGFGKNSMSRKNSPLRVFIEKTYPTGKELIRDSTHRATKVRIATHRPFYLFRLFVHPFILVLLSRSITVLTLKLYSTMNIFPIAVLCKLW